MCKIHISGLRSFHKDKQRKIVMLIDNLEHTVTMVYAVIALWFPRKVVSELEDTVVDQIYNG